MVVRGAGLAFQRPRVRIFTRFLFTSITSLCLQKLHWKIHPQFEHSSTVLFLFFEPSAILRAIFGPRREFASGVTGAFAWKMTTASILRRYSQIAKLERYLVATTFFKGDFKTFRSEAVKWPKKVCEELTRTSFPAMKKCAPCANVRSRLLKVCKSPHNLTLRRALVTTKACSYFLF